MLFNSNDILETTRMITENKLDVRTITMGISLRDCGHSDMKVTAQKVYDKICQKAENLVKTGEDLELELGVPIINKRISVTPISMVGESCDSNDYVPLAQALDKAAKAVGVNFIGGFSALVDKGYTKGDRNLIASIPEALDVTDIVCSSVSVGSTKCGINMDAVKQMGEVVKMTAARTADRDAIGCAKLVIFCNSVPDNPFMAGAFHGVGEPDVVLNVGVSGPGVVRSVLSSGTKAIGAGAGNPPVIVDDTADIEKAGKDIIDGCTFDNNLPCIAEKEVFAFRNIADELISNMLKNDFKVKSFDIDDAVTVLKEMMEMSSGIRSPSAEQVRSRPIASISSLTTRAVGRSGLLSNSLSASALSKFGLSISM